jgi:glycosyltransferase involved in cell wall biosynthesis
MKIGVDARNDRTGVGRYTFSLIRELAAIDSENEYVLFVNREHAPPGPNFRTVETAIPWFSVREQLRLPRLIARERLDLMHYPNVALPLLSRTPFVVTLHDLNYLDVEGTSRPRLKRAGYRAALAKATRARRVITVSEYSRGAVRRTLRVQPERIAVTYEAADPAGTVEPDHTILERLGLGAPFFLNVGAAYPYKNLTRLIDAFTRLDGDYRLVLAGDHEIFGAALREQAAGTRVVFPGRVSEAELAALYGGALAFAFVSYSEGFGLPGLEAMSAGVPVVAANTTSLPEIYGDAARYCDPFDVDSIAAALAEVASDGELRARLIALGHKRASEFSWRRTAEQTLAVYRDAVLD